MYRKLSNPREITEGSIVTFMYHGSRRTGTVKQVGPRHFTLEHDNPRDYSGKQFSNYRFLNLQSQIAIVSDPAVA